MGQYSSAQSGGSRCDAGARCHAQRIRRPPAVSKTFDKRSRHPRGLARRHSGSGIHVIEGMGYLPGLPPCSPEIYTGRLEVSNSWAEFVHVPQLAL
jgi:hypothetical protein